MPDLGLIEHVEFPTGPGVRFDTMLFDGLELPVFYDSLVGKLIVWAEDRELAVRRLRRALHDLIVVGIETNAPFHLALLDHPDFQTGNFHTGWLEASFEMPPLNVTTGESTALVAAAIAATVIESNSSNKSSTSPTTKWLKASRKKAVGLDITSGGSGWHSGIASR